MAVTVDLASFANDVKAGKMGKPQEMAGRYAGWIEGYECKKNKSKNDMFVVDVTLHDTDVPHMSGREIKLFFSMNIDRQVKQLVRFLMLAGVDCTTIPNDKTQMKVLKKYVAKICGECPDVEVFIQYQRDFKTGEFRTDNDGNKQTERELVACERVLDEFTDEIVINLPDLEEGEEAEVEEEEEVVEKPKKKKKAPVKPKPAPEPKPLVEDDEEEGEDEEEDDDDIPM